MERVVQSAIQIDSAQQNPPANTPLDQGFRVKWSIVLFVFSFILACALRSDATASTQIQAGSAKNASRSVVRTASGNLYAIILDTSASATVRVYESTNGGSSWTQQDAVHAPTSGFYSNPSAAIDGNGIIHVSYWNGAAGLRYVTFST